MSDILVGAGPSACIILSLAVILFAGFLATRVTKKLKLPNVTGYILSGVLIGPFVLKIVPQQVISGMDFVTDIALSYIAFGVGKYFKLSTLRRSGGKVFVVTLFESLAAAVVISLVMIFVFRLPVAFSLLLGAIGCATAPASTIMTIRQYHAKGEFVNMILQVVALDDAVALIAFSVCAAIARSLTSPGGLDFGVVVLPVLLNLLMVTLGAVLGVVLHRLINDRRSREHRLVLTNAVILSLTGLCTMLDVSPLLACMALGTAYINLSGNKELFKQINHFEPPVLLMFFVLSGMKLNVPSLVSAGVIGVVYFFVRILGKYLGATLGSAISGCSPAIKKYLGLALIPQAGVSIGLAALGQRMLPAEQGLMLSTIILSSAVLYEMIGPACAKASLFLSRSVEPEELPDHHKGRPKAEPAGEGAAEPGHELPQTLEKVHA